MKARKNSWMTLVLALCLACYMAGSNLGINTWYWMAVSVTGTIAALQLAKEMEQ